MKQICQICDKEIELGERFVQKTSYTRHDKNDERPLWTEVNIVGREESFTLSRVVFSKRTSHPYSCGRTLLT